MEFKWLADGLIELAIPVVWAKPYNRAAGQAECLYIK